VRVEIPDGAHRRHHLPAAGHAATCELWSCLGPHGSQRLQPGGEELPPKYWHCYDLFVALAAATTATTKLRVGSGICLVVERDPIITANEVASVDDLSGGRFEFGIGAGWNREEMFNHGTDPRCSVNYRCGRGTRRAWSSTWRYPSRS
jgi:alkanesulfonate monooxygenase SsuD/methylene tetrahydromethanopterin reductase-like flavin-dependent oxidoreductase (luciferase family)